MRQQGINRIPNTVPKAIGIEKNPNIKYLIVKKSNVEFRVSTEIRFGIHSSGFFILEIEYQIFYIFSKFEIRDSKLLYLVP